MAQQISGLPVRPTITALRVGFLGLAILAFILGYVGFASLLSTSSSFGDRPIDLIYYDLQLFVLGADPLQETRSYPLALETARFAAPAATAYALAELGWRLWSSQARRLRISVARRHYVVHGDGVTARTIAERLRTRGETVITTDPTREDHPEVTHGRRPPARGLAAHLQPLTLANLHRARAIYLCDDESNGSTTAALAFALSRSGMAGQGSPRVYAHIRNSELCLSLQASALETGQGHPRRPVFFNVEDLAVRTLFTREPVLPLRGRPPRVAVIGATGFGIAVLAEAARRWRAAEVHDPRRLPIAVVDPNASAAVEALSSRYPRLGHDCAVTAHDGSLHDPRTRRGLGSPPDRVFVCHDDPDEALATATVADRLWRGCTQSIVVRLEHASPSAFPVPSAPDEYPFEEVDGAIHSFGVIGAACWPETIADDLVNQVARAVHEHYRRARLAERTGDETVLSTIPWDGLAHHLRESNLTQALDIGRKLATVHRTFSLRGDGDSEARLNGLEIDQLARMEHDRWYNDRRDHGWRYAEWGDPSARTHPAMRPWRELPDWLRQRNRQAIQDLPSVLSDAGLHIVYRQ